MNRVIAALGLSQIIGYGTLYYAFPILVPFVARDFAVSEALIYAVFSAGLLVGGLAAPFAGRAMDRFGAPRLMAGGSILAGLALAVMAAAPVLWVWLAGVVLIETISVTVLYDAAFASLARLTGPAARAAITRLTLIAGFASTIFWPLTGWLIPWLGWRGTYALFAGLHLTVALGLHLWLLRRPVAGIAPARQPMPPSDGLADGLADATPPPDLRPVPDHLRQVSFRAIALSFALSGALITALGVHLVPILASAGFAAHATLVGMLVGPSQVAIRAVDATMWRALHPLTVAIISAAALPVGALALLSGVPVAVAGPAFAVLFGIGQGLSSIVRGSVPLSLFGRHGYGEVLGRLSLARTLASAGAPFLFSASVVAIGTTATLTGLVVIGAAAVWPLWRLRSRLRAEGVMGGLG